MTVATGARPAPPALGLRQNLAQFSLLVGVNALVGALVGQERAIVPLLAQREFGITGAAEALAFIVVFGVVKAATNYLAGSWSDRFGRKPVLVVGWLFAIPVPLLLIWGPSWTWVLIANFFLGINQGLTWSTAVIMKIDLAGPAKRGLAMGLNEAAGYGALALSAAATGFIAERAGLRPAPFLLGLVIVGIGLGLSAIAVRETAGHARTESGARPDAAPVQSAFALGTWRHRTLAAASRAGLVNNLAEGLAWGLLPLYFAAAGLSIARVGLLSAIAPAVWGAGQLLTGALSDRSGRKPLIAAGQWTQAAGLLGLALGDGFTLWALCSALYGAGTALAYPTLLAAVGDVAHPTSRGAAVGVYRLWRDLGFAVGAVLAGVVTDLAGPTTAIVLVAAVTAASGLDVALVMEETLPHRAPGPPGHPPRAGSPSAA